MKKIFFVILTVLCIICINGIGIISTSAFSDISLDTFSTESIGTRASADISQITYSATSTKYSADIILRRICSGNVYMELQRWNGTNWSYVDSINWSFSNKLNTGNSKNFTITQSGTYRIYLSITIDSITTIRQSSNYNF